MFRGSRFTQVALSRSRACRAYLHTSFPVFRKATPGPSATQAELPVALSRLPPTPGRAPTPLINQEEWDAYVVPLYDYGWGITENKKLDSDRKARGEQMASQLARRILFTGSDAILDFIMEYSQYIDAENHHPKITWQGVELWVHTHTHQAFRPFDVQSPDTTGEAHTTAGITIRDVRLAILAERIQDKYLKLKKVKPFDTTRGRPRSMPLTVDSLFSRGTGIHPCEICTAMHSSLHCPERYTKPPIRPCPLCRGDHWPVNCAQKSGTANSSVS